MTHATMVALPKRTLLVMAMVIAMVMAAMAPALATHVDDEVATPSTNEANSGLGWAHFNVVEDTVPGQVTVEFVQPRSFIACFEYRSDGADTTDTRDNFNTHIHDGLWPFVCLNDDSSTMTLEASEYVEIRMVFGAERTERFDWTRVDVLPIPTKDDCKDGGWETLGDYKNQGQCVKDFATS